MTVTIGRRELLAALGGAAAAWPIAPRAQQSSMPVIGFLNSETPIGFAPQAAAFRQGVSEAGYVEGENVAIVYRWADNQVGRLPELAAELVRLEVAVFATTGGVAPALAAKATTTTIPIVFMVGEDPVNLGLVASLARPNGNLTGINFFNSELVAKRLELLRELVPAATRVAVLVNPANAANAETTLRDVEAAARVIGLHQPRDQCGLHDPCASAVRCPLRWQRRLFRHPARSNRHPGGAPCGPRGICTA